MKRIRRIWKILRLRRCKTYIDLLRVLHPEEYNKYVPGGCAKCPYCYGFEEMDKNQPCIGCTKCWRRRIPKSLRDRLIAEVK